MWNLTVKFSKVSQAGEFVNRLINIKKIEYHILSNATSDIVITGENSFAKEFVLELISETIINIFKTEYFEKSINLGFLRPEQKDALVKALVLFDIDSDIYYTLLSIEKLDTIVVDAVNTFLLSKLKLKWAEFVTITNLNSDYLLNYDVFVEFLKFLINSIQPKTKVINLKCDVRNFLFLDEKNSVITSKVNIDDEMGLITNLVLLAPQNINIHCIDRVSNRTFKTLYYLFDKKINLLVW